MTPLPLECIGLRWRNHRSALWWMGVLYRRPQQLAKRLAALPKWRALCVGGILYLHILPYLVILSIIGRLIWFGALDIELHGYQPTEWSTLILLHRAFLIKGITKGITFGIFGGIICGIFEGITGKLTGGTTGEIAKGVAVGITVGIAVGIAAGIFGGITEGEELTRGLIAGVATVSTYRTLQKLSKGWS